MNMKEKGLQKKPVVTEWILKKAISGCFGLAKGETNALKRRAEASSRTPAQ
jgi:hypothetical protein